MRLRFRLFVSLVPAAAQPCGGRRFNASLAGTASRTCKSVPLRTDCAARGKHSSRCAGGAEQMSLSRSTRKRSRNQRVSNPRQRKQQHLLDVKVRARKATQHRNRRVLVFMSKIVLAAAVCSGSVFGARVAMRRFFFENPDYRLAMIDVQTDGSLLRDQVLKAADLREGENIFQVNLAQVHHVLQKLPQV